MIVLGIETSCDETAVGIVEIYDSAAEQPTGVDAMQGDDEEAQQDVQNGTLREHRSRSTQQSAASTAGSAGHTGGQSNTVCRLLANVVATSMDLHKVYGGVVPEIAARSHIESMLPVVDEALAIAFGNDMSSEQGATSNEGAAQNSFDHWSKIDAIAVTYGAGLGGSLLVGVMTARTLAIVKNKPLYAVNHVEAHVYANFLTEVGYEVRGTKNEAGADAAQNSKLKTQNAGVLQGRAYQMRRTQPEFPMLALIVSGGHSQLALFRNHFDYTLLGQTRDDAVGEAFDKVAKIVGLPYPGGPSVAQAAEKGDPHKYSFPKAKLEGESEALKDLRSRSLDLRGAAANSKIQDLRSKINYDFSFSGVKTAVLRLAQKEIGEDFTFPSRKVPKRLSETQQRDIAASFQRIAIETLVDKTVAAYEEFQPNSVVIAGGVAASRELRAQLTERLPIDIEYPDMKLCTDNGAMIATLGCFKAQHGQPTADPYSLDIEPNLCM